jgi:hypothetical protein
MLTLLLSSTSGFSVGRFLNYNHCNCHDKCIEISVDGLLFCKDQSNLCDLVFEFHSDMEGSVKVLNRETHRDHSRNL